MHHTWLMSLHFKKIRASDSFDLNGYEYIASEYRTGTEYYISAILYFQDTFKKYLYLYYIQDTFKYGVLHLARQILHNTGWRANWRQANRGVQENYCLTKRPLQG